MILTKHEAQSFFRLIKIKNLRDIEEYSSSLLRNDVSNCIFISLSMFNLMTIKEESNDKIHLFRKLQSLDELGLKIVRKI